MMSRAPDVATLEAAHHAHWGVGPQVVVRSPGRVNLIGDHTDYNGGYAMPAAIDRGTLVAVSMAKHGRLRAHSADQQGMIDVDLAQLEAPSTSWSPYVRGPLWMLAQQGLRWAGLDVTLRSDLPMGAGLSSSASVEMGVAMAALHIAGASRSTSSLAQLCQQAEQQVAGVNCGILDMLAIGAGQTNHALLMDCRSLEVTPTMLPADAAVVVLDTQTSRSLASSAYNERRAACEAAAAILGVPFVSDATTDAFTDVRLTAEQQRCVRHVVSENERVLLCAAAFARGDLVEAGAHFHASHESLRHDYQVSSPALDAMVEAARASTGVYGARLTGAGFGGCVVALVHKEQAQSVVLEACHRYGGGRGFVVRASAGTHVVS
jgi:galactokinase